MDVIIKNGIVVDGTGRKGMAADVSIQKEKSRPLATWMPQEAPQRSLMPREG